jgi:hypothetical protein
VGERRCVNHVGADEGMAKTVRPTLCCRCVQEEALRLC